MRSGGGGGFKSSLESLPFHLASLLLRLHTGLGGCLTSQNGGEEVKHGVLELRVTSVSNVHRDKNVGSGADCGDAKTLLLEVVGP